MPRVVFSDSDDDNGTQPLAAKGPKQHQRGAPAGSPGNVATAVSTGPKTTPTMLTPAGTEVPARVNNKVFVDGLPYFEPAGEAGSLERQLAEFVTAWKVGKMVHLTKKPGQGFGYIAFRSPESVDVAVRVLNGKKFLNRFLRVEVPKPPAALRDMLADGEPDQKVCASPQARADAASFARQVLISDLPPHAQPDILRQVLAEYCPALETSVSLIKMTSRNRKAFVTLDTEAQAAELARFLKGFTVLGRRVDAQLAMPPGSAPFAAAVMRRWQEQLEAAAAQPQPVASDSALEVVPRDAVAARFAPPVDVVKSNARKAYPMPDLVSSAPEAGSRRARDAAPFDRVAAPRRPPAPHEANPACRFNQRGSRVVYIANVSPDVTEGRLRQHCSAAGALRRCTMQLAPDGTPTGIATLEYALPAEARACVERLDGSMLAGAPIQIERDGDEGAAAPDWQARIVATTARAGRNRAADEPDEEEMERFVRKYGAHGGKRIFAEAMGAAANAAPAQHDEAAAQRPARGGFGRRGRGRGRG